MREFWDARAAEDAYYFVDNRLAYSAPDAKAFWRGGEELVAEILELLDLTIRPDDELVEIGCGIGRLTRPLAARGASMRAVDVSPRMLALAREHNPGLANVAWVLGDGRTLSPIADRSADGCFSHVVFQHLPDPAIALGYVREMGRVLRPGGWAAFQVSNAPQVHRRPPLGRRARGFLDAVRGRGPRGQGHRAWRGSAVDLELLRAVAAEAGLEVERTVGAGTQFCFVRLRAQPSASA
jgi:SAM-dependent methyltransferase